jgi:hypothetical protein
VKRLLRASSRRRDGQAEEGDSVMRSSKTRHSLFMACCMVSALLCVAQKPSVGNEVEIISGVTNAAGMVAGVYFNDSYNQYVRTCNIKSIGGLVTSRSLFPIDTVWHGTSIDQARMSLPPTRLRLESSTVLCATPNRTITPSIHRRIRDRGVLAGSCYLNRNSQISGLFARSATLTTIRINAAPEQTGLKDLRPPAISAMTPAPSSEFYRFQTQEAYESEPAYTGHSGLNE